MDHKKRSNAPPTAAAAAATVIALLVAGCAVPGGFSKPPRTTEVDAGRVAEVVAGGRLVTSSLEPWFDYESQVAYRFEVPGAEALAWWKALRAEFEATGYWPVLLGPPDDAAMVDEMRGFDDYGPSELDVTIVAGFDLAHWRGARVAEYARWGEEPHGPWPGTVSGSDFMVDVDLLTGNLVPTVVVGLVPVVKSWELPLALRYGGWNDCPEPMVHAATLRDWERRFRAEPVTLAGDVVELRVGKPPRDRDAAIEIAREHYLYCGDIVWQGTDDLETLAASLLDAPVWFFWWD